MADPEVRPETTLQIRRTMEAPRERVFEAWTQPELFVRWFTPLNGYSLDARIDLRVGGTWSVRMKPRLLPAGRAFGSYIEIDPPALLVYTIAWERFPFGPESLVTVEFHDLGGSTEVVLTHERLGTRRGRVSHGTGWRHSLRLLRELVEAPRS